MLLPSVSPLCMKANEDLLHLFMICPFSSFCWSNVFSIFKIDWVFDGSLSSNVLQLLTGPFISKKPILIWVNMSKALLAKVWFEHNQWIFQYKARPRLGIVCSAERNAAAWCALNKEFENYSIQDICLNCDVFLSQPVL